MVEKEMRRKAAMRCASFMGFESGGFTLMELDEDFGLFCVDGVDYLAIRRCEVIDGEDPPREPLGFAEMAKAAGLPQKIGYSSREVADATGVSYSTVCRCAKDGSLKSYLPVGMQRGRLMTPAMVDDWLNGGRV